MIIHEVEQVCSILGDLAGECKALIEQFGPSLISSVAKAVVSTIWIRKVPE